MAILTQIAFLQKTAAATFGQLLEKLVTLVLFHSPPSKEFRQNVLLKGAETLLCKKLDRTIYSFICYFHQFKYSFFNGPILASFCLFFVFSTCYNSNIILWKHRWCGWDSNPGGKMEGADDSTELRRHTDWLYQSSYDWLCPDKCNFA